MHPKLDLSFRDIVACPLCKTPVVLHDAECVCYACGQHFMCSAKGVWNFMLAYPSFLAPEHYQVWARGQTNYETWDMDLGQQDDYYVYLAEIDSVREIYTQEFSLNGRILDVGGHHGRLRHFLPQEAEYLSIDPFATVFDNLEHHPNLLRAYPRLHEPCNFLQALAERLPLQTSTFDYVHMRSVLDHFFDPYLALCEARRVLRVGGGD